MAKNNIHLFHGTNANALPNILKYGINSSKQSTQMGITVSTGEEWSRKNGARSCISFTDDLNTALDYAGISSYKDNSQEELSFGILIGISLNDIKKMKTCIIHSDLPEIGIMDNVPLENIKVIAVPKNKVEFVRKLVNNDQIIITPIEIDKRFYYIDSYFEEITFNAEKAKELMKYEEQSKTFDSEAVKKLARERKISGIRGIYGKIQEKINSRGKNNEKDSRDK